MPTSTPKAELGPQQERELPQSEQAPQQPETPEQLSQRLEGAAVEAERTLDTAIVSPRLEAMQHLEGQVPPEVIQQIEQGFEAAEPAAERFQEVLAATGGREVLEDGATESLEATAAQEATEAAQTLEQDPRFKAMVEAEALRVLQADTSGWYDQNFDRNIKPDAQGYITDRQGRKWLPSQNLSADYPKAFEAAKLRFAGQHPEDWKRYHTPNTETAKPLPPLEPLRSEPRIDTAEIINAPLLADDPTERPQFINDITPPADIPLPKEPRIDTQAILDTPLDPNNPHEAATVQLGPRESYKQAFTPQERKFFDKYNKQGENIHEAATIQLGPKETYKQAFTDQEREFFDNYEHAEDATVKKDEAETTELKPLDLPPSEPEKVQTPEEKKLAEIQQERDNLLKALEPLIVQFPHLNSILEQTSGLSSRDQASQLAKNLTISDIHKAQRDVTSWLSEKLDNSAKINVPGSKTAKKAWEAATNTSPAKFVKDKKGTLIQGAEIAGSVALQIPLVGLTKEAAGAVEVASGIGLALVKGLVKSVDWGHRELTGGIQQLESIKTIQEHVKRLGELEREQQQMDSQKVALETYGTWEQQSKAVREQRVQRLTESRLNDAFATQINATNDEALIKAIAADKRPFSERVTIADEAAGGGAVYTIEVVETAADGTPQKVEKTFALDGKEVKAERETSQLVVDHEPAIRQLVRELLYNSDNKELKALAGKNHFTFEVDTNGSMVIFLADEEKMRRPIVLEKQFTNDVLTALQKEDNIAHNYLKPDVLKSLIKGLGKTIGEANKNQDPQVQDADSNPDNAPTTPDDDATMVVQPQTENATPGPEAAPTPIQPVDAKTEFEQTEKASQEILDTIRTVGSSPTVDPLLQQARELLVAHAGEALNVRLDTKGNIVIGELSAGNAIQNPLLVIDRNANRRAYQTIEATIPDAVATLSSPDKRIAPVTVETTTANTAPAGPRINLPDLNEPPTQQAA